MRLLKGSLTEIRTEQPATAESSLQNIATAISELRECPAGKRCRRLQELRPDDVYNSEETMYEFLAIIKAVFLPGDSELAEDESAAFEGEEAKESTAKFAGNEMQAQTDVPPPPPPAKKVEEKINKSAAPPPQRDRQPSAQSAQKPANRPPRPPELRTHRASASRSSLGTGEKSRKPAAVSGEAEMSRCIVQGIVFDAGGCFVAPAPAGPVSVFLLSQNEDSDLLGSPVSAFTLQPEIAPAPASHSRTTSRSFVTPPSTSKEPSELLTVRTGVAPSSRRAPSKGSSPSPPKSNRTSRTAQLQSQSQSRSQLQTQAKTVDTSPSPTAGADSRLPKVDVKTKHALLTWMERIQLIKPNSVTIAEFPGYCRNGVLLSDLILRLEGVFAALFDRGI